MFKRRKKYQSNLTSYDKALIVASAFLCCSVSLFSTSIFGLYYMKQAQKQTEAYKKYNKKSEELENWIKKIKMSHKDDRIEKIKTGYRCNGIGVKEVFINE